MKTRGKKSFLISDSLQGALPRFSKLLLLSLALFWLAPAATAADGMLLGKHEVHPTRILARLRQDARTLAGPNLARAGSPLGLEVRRQYRSVPGLVLLDDPGAPAFASGFTAGELESRRTRLLERIDSLNASGLFLYVEPDYQVQANLEPNDQAFVNGTLWGLRNLGISGGLPGADISATNAWDITTGDTNVVVAVIDTGINYNHLELAPQMWRNPNEIPGNGLDDDGNGYVDDVFGINAITNSGNPLDDHNHGSHCSGTIGAAANDGNPHVGVAWQVRLMACKFLSASGSGYISDAIECVNYAVSKRAKILSNSWGGGGYSQAMRDAIATANAQQILFVAAAGNDARNTDPSPNYPSCYDVNNVISVAAMDRADNLASFSNYGATSVDLGAPGVAIYSTFAGANNAYGTYNGTSMACPHVVGVAALLCARYSTNITVAELRQRLLETTTPVAALNGRTVTGGRVNAYQALQVAEDGVLEVRVSFAATPPLRAGSTTVVFFAVSDFTPVTNASVSAVVAGQGALGVRNDGAAPDAVASDRNYSAYLVVPTTDSQMTLTFVVTAPGKTPFTNTLSVPVLFPPANDHFADRLPIAGTSNRVFGANVGASAEPGEPAHFGSTASKSVWWTWTALVADTATISTEGSSFDTTLAVYTGTDLAGLVRIVDDDNGGGGLTSQVNFQASPGTTYQIAVDGYAEAEGNIVLTVFQPAAAVPAIFQQPGDQHVLPGGTAAFAVQAGGPPPLRYQWHFDGNALPDATGENWTVAAAGHGDVGNYFVVIENDLGATTSRLAQLRLIEVANGFFDDFEPAEDPPQWTSFGGQVLATNFGSSVSGANSLWFNGEVPRSAVTRPLDAPHGGEVGFWLRFGNTAGAPWERPELPGEGVVLEYSVDGGSSFTQFLTCDTPEFFSWTRRLVALPSAAYGPATLLRWRQLGHSGNNTDHWALDDIAVTLYASNRPPEFVVQPQSQSVGAGSPARFTPVVAGTEPILLQWFKDGVPLPNATNLALVLAAVQPVDAGVYHVQASNLLGLASSGVAELTVPPGITLADALDTPDLTWTSAGAAVWSSQSATTQDGLDAAQSGPIADSQETWLQTTLTGPGTLTFWWSVSSETGYDYLEFRTNGVLVTHISGSVNWIQQTIAIRPGPQTLRWRYLKDYSVSSGQDRGWVDQVVFVPAGPPPDLTPLGGVVRSTVTGRTVTVITVVTNRGEGVALGSWSDGWYWSPDGVWGTNVTFLTATTQSGPIPAAGSYARTNTLSVPAWAEGAQHLIMYLDRNNAVYEGEEINNFLALAVTNVPDLRPVAVELTNAPVSGKTLGVVSVVTNQGAGVAAGGWADYVYLSTDAVWGTNDLQLTYYTQSAAVTNGLSYRRTNNVTLPNWAGGAYYLIFRGDRNNALYELSDANNELAVPVSLTSPDLLPLAGNVSSVVSGRTLSVATVVTNQGDGAALGSWSDGWYWSTNATWETNDTYLTAFSKSGPVAPGGSYTRTNTLTVPVAAAGAYYLLLRADYNNGLYEASEANNTLALAVTNVPDLRPVALALTNAPVSGKPLGVVTVVTNAGTGVAGGSWADYLYLSTDAVWGTNDLQLTTYTQSTAVTNGTAYRRTNNVTLPNWAGGAYYLLVRSDPANALYELTDTNNELAVAVTLAVPDLAPVVGSVSPVVSGRTLSVVSVVANQGDGAALGSWSDGWYWSTNATWETNDTYLTAFSQAGPVGAGGSYTRTNTLTVPVGTSGPQYLLLRADYNNGLYEASEANNTLALAVTNVPDLRPVALALTNTPVSGKTLGVVTVVTNQGTGVAAGSWADYLYLSTDAVWGTNDLQLTTYTQSTAVTNGTAYRRTNNVTLPNWAGGAYYLLVRADRNNALYELTDTNNDLAVPVTLTVPDLVVANLAWGGGNPIPGWPLTVVWSVANAGNGMASPAWSDTVYFSTNSVLDGADTQLRSQSRGLALTAGGSYQVTNTVTIPANAPQSYYLIVKTDDQNAIFEANEANNWRAFGIGQYLDADGDGIPDSWEQQYFGSASNCAPGADGDGDGIPNLSEYLADTIPTNALSVLRFSRIVPEANGVRLEWQGGVAARQFLERSRSFGTAGDNWLTLFTNNPPTPLQTNLFDLLGTNRALFYRVRAVRE